MISLHHEIFGRQYVGLFKIPFGTCNRYRFTISTRTGNLKVKMPDGEIVNYNTSKLVDGTISEINGFERNYSTPYSPQDIEVTSIKGNSDIYSIVFGWANEQYNDNYNIQDIGTFLAQFPNLYSINYDIYAYGRNSNRPTIKGNLFALPKSVTRVRVGQLDVLNRPNDTYGNFDSFTNDMQLTYYYDGDTFISGGSKYYGDLAKTPPNVNFLKITATNNSSLTYTAGKTWTSSFDTLDLGNATISYSDIDNLLNDMNNSITTAIEGKRININGGYTNTSAYNGLIAKGFTITGLTLYVPYELKYDFNGNFNDTNGINNLVQNGTVTFTTDRKGGNTAVQFSSGYLQTTNNLPASSVWSISFWIKTMQTAESNLFELGGSWDLVDSFMIAMNVTAWSGTNRLSIHRSNDRKTAPYIINDNLWHHVYIEIKRNNTKVLIDNIEQTLINIDIVNNTGNFRIDKLFIGGRNGGSYFFNGALDDIKIYNRTLIQSEITNLYNE